MSRYGIWAIVPLLMIGMGVGCADRAEKNATATHVAARTATQPAEERMMQGDFQKATFGAGCFWGVEARFRKVPGVVDTAVGYCGGHTDRPTYHDVCTDRTGHAEVVQVTYDPAKVSYDQLLEVFWNSHDPTQLNRQGPDVGTQYRSAIFYHTPEQEAAATASKKQLDTSGRFRRPIVTQIEPAPPFWQAEEYHQRYLEKRGQESCGTGH